MTEVKRRDPGSPPYQLSSNASPERLGFRSSKEVDPLPQKARRRTEGEGSTGKNSPLRLVVRRELEVERVRAEPAVLLVERLRCHFLPPLLSLVFPIGSPDETETRRLNKTKAGWEGASLFAHSFDCFYARTCNNDIPL